MFWFPLINLVFLILIYRIHKEIFYGASLIVTILYVGWVFFIERYIAGDSYQFLYYLSLTGAGLIIGVAAFLLAISVNHKHLYSDLETPKD
jgi:hypothetical protein